MRWARDLCVRVRGGARRPLPPAAAGSCQPFLGDLYASFPGPPDTCLSLGKGSVGVSELWSAHPGVPLAPGAGWGLEPSPGRERSGAERIVGAGCKSAKFTAGAPNAPPCPARRSSAEVAGPDPGTACAARPPGSGAIHFLLPLSQTWTLTQTGTLTSSFLKVAAEPARGAASGMQRLGEGSKPRNNTELWWPPEVRLPQAVALTS